MLVHQGEGSDTPSEPHHTPFPKSFALLTVADKPASPVRDVNEGEACPTESGFIANQDKATIVKSFTLPHDSAPRVTSPAADEGSMQHNNSELTALCTSLQRQYSELQAKFQAQEEEIVKLKDRVKVLEDREGVAAKQFGDDVLIKGRSINEEEAAAERISNNSEEIARVLTSMDATTVLAGGIDVPTGSGFIPTVGPPAIVISTGSEVGPTASPIVPRRKGKEVMVESDTPKKKKLQEQIDAQVARELEEQQEKENMRMNEQIARDAKVARINAEEELQGMIDSLDQARIAQSSALPTVADEPASPMRDDSQGEACPTNSDFIADQDRATIAKSFTLPHDLAPKVTSPAADEGSMQQNISELTALCTSLQRQYSELMSKFQAQEEEIGRLKEWVQVLEDKEAVATKQSGEDAPIKGMSTNEGEATAERISNDSEEIARVLTSMDAATILARETDVPTGSGFTPTAGPPATVISTGSEVGPTTSPIVTRRKGKEVMVESDTPKKKKLQEHIDAQVARELEEQQERERERI
nr:hypothetical protein [Tanacetum cinerariifolium]